MDSEIKAMIFYYFREKFYNSMVAMCKEGMNKFKADVSFKLFHSLSLILINRLEEGIHDLETIRAEQEIRLAVTIALMYGNKALGVGNKDLFVKLDSQMRQYRKSAEAVDFYYSAFVLLTFNKIVKALDYVDKALSVQDNLVEALNLKGWILLLNQRRGIKSRQPKDIFEKSLKLTDKNLDAILGLTECSDFNEALNIINKAVVKFGNSLVLIQKLRLLFSAQNYDEVFEVISRITALVPNDLDCLKITVIILLTKDSNFAEAVAVLRKLTTELERTEVDNSVIFLENAQLFARICNRNKDVLAETYKMLEIALKFNSENADVITELGYQNLIQGRIKEAQKYFKSATKIDEASLSALLGLSLCELSENGKTNQLAEQIQYLRDLKGADESEILHFIQAKILDDPYDILKALNQIYDLKMHKLKFLWYSDVYLRTLDPDFSLDVVKEYLATNNCSNEPRVLKLLKIIVKSAPGLIEALFLLAKVQYLMGEYNNALATLEKILKANSLSEAHLLMAQIQIHNGLYERAAQSLEVCVSNNFRIRENPVYHYITGIVDKNLKNYPDAVKSLTTALTLVNANSLKTQSLVTLTEKASIYVELIDTLNIIGQNEEASKILEEATKELQGTAEEAKIVLLSADHSIKRNNVQGAIDLLARIKPSEPCFLEAKTKHAEILLKYRKDKYAFIDCYQEMVQQNPSPESYVLLGDAFIKILEPDEALNCYQKALNEKPKDPFLVQKMGRALIQTHYFKKAVNYYCEAIKDNDDPELKLELADLYFNLKEYEKGEAILLEEIRKEDIKDLDDLTYLQFKSRVLKLLAQIQERNGNTAGAMLTLKDAMDNHIRVKKRLMLEQSGSTENEVKDIVEAAVKLADISMGLKNNEKAINFLKEGLDACPNNITILIALAKLYMQLSSLELCQQTCTTVLRLDPDNEAASVMMADIAFRKIDLDMAQFHFTQLISKQPTNWEALIRLIEILRRSGNINESPEYLSSAEAASSNPSKEAGLIYAKSLYQWYSGNLNSALKNFNSIRQDAEYGQQAIYNMIEICLNPDDELMTEQFVDTDDMDYRDSRSMALQTADRLLRELKQRLESNGDEILKYKLLSNFRLLATKEKFNIERALDDFLNLAAQNAYRDHIGVILGISTAYTLLKQSQRAKNQLKRIAKSPWTFEDAEYLERCWLLLADYYIQSTKFDIATDLLNRVLQHNKSCTKAYEFFGFISEKEQKYKEAANYYENAWKFGGKTNPTVGYKLAYNLMKSKRFADAIDTAQDVLKLNPDYPRIKKDILDKSMNNLRI